LSIRIHGWRLFCWGWMVFLIARVFREIVD
jgi:hypothetical protein